jgi:hypothetical protein
MRSLIPLNALFHIPPKSQLADHRICQNRLLTGDVFIYRRRKAFRKAKSRMFYLTPRKGYAIEHAFGGKFRSQATSRHPSASIMLFGGARGQVGVELERNRLLRPLLNHACSAISESNPKPLTPSESRSLGWLPIERAALGGGIFF